MTVFLSADEAVKKIRSSSVVAIEGSGGGLLEATSILEALERRFLTKHKPKNLTIIHTTGIGDRSTRRGLGALAHPGLVKCGIGGHWGQSPDWSNIASNDLIEAYNWPQGVIAQLYREIAAKRPGVITHIGLGTFIDPRYEGGKMNKITTKNKNKVIKVAGREWLFYPSFPIDVSVIVATTADENGYLSYEHEPAILDVLSVAQAAHNSGGIVIAEVKRLAKAGTLSPREVRVPGVLVDIVVVNNKHSQLYDIEYNPSLSGEIRVPNNETDNMPMNERKVIARRAALELLPQMIVNLGVGMPDGVASVAREEGILSKITLTIEQGLYGGTPEQGIYFGVSSNPLAIIDQPSQFDFYDGGGIDITCLGFAQVDCWGNVNVSKFGQTIMGVGGFVNISQSTRRVLFCGTLTAGDLHTTTGNGLLEIKQEGKHKKFVKGVDQITFNGKEAIKRGQKVSVITERCVFDLINEGIVLSEIAPGINIDKDIINQMGFTPIIPDSIKTMDKRLFSSPLMGLSYIFDK